MLGSCLHLQKNFSANQTHCLRRKTERAKVTPEIWACLNKGPSLYVGCTEPSLGRVPRNCFAKLVKFSPACHSHQQVRRLFCCPHLSWASEF